MTEYSLVNQIFIFTINTTGLLLAFWVLLTKRRDKVNQLFFLMTIFILSWITFYYLMNLPSQAPRALLWSKLGYGAVLLFFTTAYLFFSFILKEGKKFLVLNKIVLSFGILLTVASLFTNLIAKDVELQKWGVNPVLGEGKIFFYGFIIFLTCFIISRLLLGYFRFPKEEKLKIQYFLIGVLIFAGMNFIFNVVFPALTGIYQYSLFGNYSVIFLLGFTAFAIVKRELFEIKVILTALLVGLIAILFLLDALIFSQDLSFQIIKGIIFFIFLFFGYSLIKSVQLEIKRREELESLTSELEITNIKLTAAYKKLEKLDKAKSEFVSIASHQLRTPLTAVKGYLSMVLEGSYGKLPRKMEKPLGGVYTSNQRLIKLVNDLLSISRIEAGKIELELEKASIEEIISGVVEELKLVAEKKNIYLKAETPAHSAGSGREKPLPKILLDRDKIRQVVINIIDNAIRYTEKGGIKVKLQMTNDKLQIIIADTGEGMTKEEIDKLFESFSRGTAGTRFWTEGAGLGLYIARKFVEMHQGKIWAESEGKERGSTFHIELPIRNDFK